jgi:hypothetical protein
MPLRRAFPAQFSGVQVAMEEQAINTFVTMSRGLMIATGFTKIAAIGGCVICQ